MEIIFWLSLGIAFYAYLGYGIVLAALVIIKRKFNGKKPTFSPDYKPTVSFVVPSYNEQDIIAAKIKNCLAQDYPSHLLKIIIITDGSADETPNIVSTFSNVQLLHKPERGGKTAAENRAMEHIDSEIVIFSDANTELPLDAVSKLVRHYEDPMVGAVSGEKRILSKESDIAAGAGEGIYWKYESFLKKLDSELLTIVGAAGELFSFRKKLFEPLSLDTILDDFILSMHIAQKGYRVIYEPEAYAMETSSASMKDELKRKIRICAGGWQAMVRLWKVLLPWPNPLLTFQYISHRVLRWSVVPLCLLLAFFVNIFLATTSAFYFLTMVAQLAFYFLALVGLYLQQRSIKSKVFFVPYYFTVMNYSVLAGFWRFLKGKQSAAWERSARAK